jgi:2-keto-4-pentenoate hydratase/2-oxohepta-3-ene-1,7-dioic acid hydratase in catechol pathway
MKLASFVTAAGPSYGRVVGMQIVDLGAAFGPSVPDLRSLLADKDRLDEASRTDGPLIALTDVQLLPPVPNHACKMLALGWAYRDHAAETQRPPDEFPFFFLKHPQSFVGAGQPIIRPAISAALDFEGELAVIIGKAGRAIAEESALEHVAGYSIFMDGSVRDWQKHSVTAGKNFDRTSPYGPWIVTADEIPDPARLSLETRVNGRTMQSTTVDKLIWSIPQLISYCSQFMTLLPGDALSTGTPGGVGHKRSPQMFLKAGDVVEVEVPGIGILTNPVADEA